MSEFNKHFPDIFTGINQKDTETRRTGNHFVQVTTYYGIHFIQVIWVQHWYAAVRHLAVLRVRFSSNLLSAFATLLSLDMLLLLVKDFYFFLAISWNNCGNILPIHNIYFLLFTYICSFLSFCHCHHTSGWIAGYTRKRRFVVEMSLYAALWGEWFFILLGTLDGESGHFWKCCHRKCAIEFGLYVSQEIFIL